MQRLVLACALVLLVACALARADGYDLGSFRLALINDPVRIEFQSGTTLPTRDNLQQTIKSAAASRNWKVTDQGDGRMELLNVVRDTHVVSIEVTYEATGYRIRYLRSINLLYREQGAKGSTLRVIHKNYNVWINELVTAINSGMQARTQTTMGFAPVDKVDAVPFLKQKGRSAYEDFLGAETPRAFAIAPNGSWGGSWGRDTQRTFSARQDVTERALELCNTRGEGQCRLYAVDSSVVWTTPEKGTP